MDGRECVLGDQSQPQATVALLGDSHADHLLPALQRLADAQSWRLLVYTKSSCSGFERERELSPQKVQDQHDSCVEWGARVRAEIAANADIDLVLLSSNERANRLDEEAIADDMKELTAAGTRLAVVTDVPGLDDDERGPSCVEDAISRGEKDDPCARPLNRTPGPVSATAEQLEIPIVDLRSSLCTGDLCHAVIGGTIVYHDRAHLTLSFAQTLTPWFADQLNPLISPRQD